MRGFEGFHDSPDAPFYRSGAKSSQETWAEATRRLNLVLESATADAERRPALMTVERVCGWHRAIFLTTFPAEAGRVREDHEPVSFGVALEFEGEMRSSPIHGVLPRTAILERLRIACETFNASRAMLQRRGSPLDAAEGAAPAAELYAQILEIHPFVDGNLRAAYVALHVGLVSVGLPVVDFRDRLDRHDECLGWAMRSDARRTTEPLVRLIVELMT
jgi:fido (protein-threonine AMPylation protein)